MALESDIKKVITEHLRALGYKVHRMQSGKVRVKGGWMYLCEEGTPDLFVPELLLWIETKQPGEVPSDIQKQRRKEYLEMGHRHLIADCLDDVVDFIRAY